MSIERIRAVRPRQPGGGLAMTVLSRRSTLHVPLISVMLLSAFLLGCSGAPAASPTPAATVKPAAPAQPAASPSPAAASVADRLQGVSRDVDSALTALGAADLARARAAFEAIDEGWDKVEDEVKAKS